MWGQALWVSPCGAELGGHPGPVLSPTLPQLPVGHFLTYNSSRAPELPAGTSLVVQWLKLHLPNAGGAGSIPDQGVMITHALGPKNQNIKQKQYCNKFNKDLKKNGPHQRKKSFFLKRAI